MSIFMLPAVQRALISSLIVGILLPIVGTYTVMRKSAFLGAGVAHIAFAGVAFGFFVHFSPLFFASLFALIGSLFLWYGKRRGLLEEDATIGILFAVAMALAVIFLGKAKAYGTEALSYLFGNLLAVSKGDIWPLVGVTLVAVLFVFLFYKELFFITFSEELARAQQVPVDSLSLFLLLITAMSIVFSLKAVGALLVFGLLVAPPAAALQWTYRMDVVLLLSVLYGALSSIVGITSSIFFDLSASSAAVIVSFLILLISFYFSPKRG